MSQEDKFILYASLKSSNGAFMISNDQFINFVGRINTSAILFKNWMFHRRCSYKLVNEGGIENLSIQVKLN